MTTGTLDDSINWRTELNGKNRPVSVGYRSFKTWNGADYPPNKPTYTTVYSYPYGSKSYIRQRIVQRPPKRARVEEHFYTMNGNFTSDRQFSALDLSDGSTIVSTYPDNFGSFSSTQLWDSNDDLKLIVKLREKVAGSDFNAGVFLAEAHQSLTMIGDAANRVSRGLRLFRKGQWAGAWDAVYAGSGKRPKKFGKSSADNWLMFVYGVVPLLKDAEAGAESLAKILNFPMEQTYSVSRRVPGVFTPSYPFSEWAKKEVYTAVRIKAKVSEVNVPQLIGLTDVASVVWEKIPYSFVADWFIPIGSYLSSRGLAQALTGTFVVSRKVYAYGAFPSLVAPSSYRGESLYQSGQVQFTRTVSNSLEVPLPSFKGLAKSASWQHCANAVALAIGSWKR